MTLHPRTPSLPDRDADDVLAELVAKLIALGEEALADDEAHGSDWGVYADWAWRAGIEPHGSSPDDVRRWLDDDGVDIPDDEVAAVLEAISTVHREAGHVDPTEGIRS